MRPSDMRTKPGGRPRPVAGIGAADGGVRRPTATIACVYGEASGGMARASDARRGDMTLAIGDTAPDFAAETTDGSIRFHDWIGDKWAVLFSHPTAFQPVCHNETGHMAKIRPEFDRRGVRIIG